MTKAAKTAKERFTKLAPFSGNAPRYSVVRSADFQRIAVLPRRGTWRDYAEALEAVLALPPKAPGTCPAGCPCQGTGVMHLRPRQAWTLAEAFEQRGALGFLSVGEGKSLVSLVLSTLMGWKRPVLFVPASLRDKTFSDWAQLSRHWRVPPLSGPGSLEVCSYEMLSQASFADYLSLRCLPDGIIADECFPSDTSVMTERGEVPISELVEAREDIRVFSVDEDGQIVLRRITEWFKMLRRQRLVRIRHEHGELVCTENHEVWTREFGFVAAGHLPLGVHLGWKNETNTGKVLRKLWEETRKEATTEREMGVSGECSSTTFLQHELRLGEDGSAEDPASDAGEEVRNVQQGSETKNLSWRTQRSPEHVEETSFLQSEVLSQSADREKARRAAESEDLHAHLSAVREGISSSEEATPEVLRSRMWAGRTDSSWGRSKEAAFEENVRALRQGVRIFSRLQKASRETFLRQELSGKIEDERSEFKSEIIHRRESPKSSSTNETSVSRAAGTCGSLIEAYEGTKSDTASRCVGPDVEGAERKNLSQSRRQWAVDQTADRCGRSDRTADRVFDSNFAGERIVSELADGIQGRSCSAGGEAGDRDRRQDASHEEVAISRQEEDGDLELSRVEGVEVLESGSGRGRIEGGGDDSFVYCLEVEGTHNFFADGILVSNCHKLSRRRSARSKRILRYFNQFPETEFVGLSGSIVHRSLMDYGHLALLALKEHAPMPHSFVELQTWADALDDNVPEYARPEPGALMDFCAQGENVRTGYKRRLLETPGIISSAEMSTNVGLQIAELMPPETPPALLEAFQRLRNTKELPGGEFCATVLDQVRHARELFLGFYLRWMWPDGEKDDEWLDARRRWRRFVRKQTSRSHGGRWLDTELQVANEVQRGRLDAQVFDKDKGCVHDVYNEWRSVREERKARWGGREEPPKEVVWISDYMVERLERWARENTGIVWVENIGLLEKLRERGNVCYGAGENAISSEKGKRSVFASHAHSVGKNLQMFHQMCFSNPLQNGRAWEQGIGRMHRQGQLADDVLVDLFLGCRETWWSFEKARADARYIEETTGQPQRLNRATYLLKTTESVALARCDSGDPLWAETGFARIDTVVVEKKFLELTDGGIESTTKEPDAR